MSVLVFVEHHEGEAAKGSLGVLANAGGLDGDVSAVLLGEGVRPLADGLGAYGAAKVYVADDAALADPLPQPRVDVLADSCARAAPTPCCSPRRCSARTWPRALRPVSTQA